MYITVKISVIKLEIFFCYVSKLWCNLLASFKKAKT